MTERVINTLPGKKAESINLFAFDSDRITFVFTDDFSSIIYTTFHIAVRILRDQI